MFRNTYLRDPDFNKWVIRLALPRALEYLLNVGINALNNLLTGMYFGEVEMSAISQTASVFSIYEVVTYGFASSCGILVAQYWGKRRTDSIKDILSIAIRLELLIGVIFSSVMLLAPSGVMTLMSTDADVVRLGAEYLRICAPVYLIHGITNAMISSFSALELVQFVVAGHAVFSVTNLLLSLFLVPRFGVAGAAVASLVSRLLSFMFAVIIPQQESSVPSDRSAGQELRPS